MARLNTRDRLHQVARWARHTFEIDFRLRVEKRMPREYRGCLGAVEFPDGLPPLIRVKPTNRSQSVDTLLHEVAHIIQIDRHGWKESRRNEGHDRQFALVAHGVLMRFTYDGGEGESLDF